ncbi:hypothetical protein FHP25_14725 [Vineibacter terrae]|uniref:Uncharacterized protein n=1 Tax=Vineibacter terrae TaxID=2586908 RepID=A0A5C8PMY3_9HYPH|nr:hypothetical protein [Vineibacter terrae]TXL75136.1 hypothetical protein FHP25_14725 [Vineibacter terrae]
MSDAKEFPLLDSLTHLPDERLRAVIERARKLLADRESGRQERALAEVRRIIKENGLMLTARRKPGKPGRPPKSQAA